MDPKTTPKWLLRVGGDRETREATGQLAPLATGSFAPRFDPLGGDGERSDLGWIGEDKDGVWLAWHPIAALGEYPDLYEAYFRFKLNPELTERDLDTLSAWEFRLKEAYVGAWERRQAREDHHG